MSLNASVLWSCVVSTARGTSMCPRLMTVGRGVADPDFKLGASWHNERTLAMCLICQAQKHGEHEYLFFCQRRDHHVGYTATSPKSHYSSIHSQDIHVFPGRAVQPCTTVSHRLSPWCGHEQARYLIWLYALDSFSAVCQLSPQALIFHWIVTGD